MLKKCVSFKENWYFEFGVYSDLDLFIIFVVGFIVFYRKSEMG